MKLMYIKYSNGIRHSIIKENENSIVNNSKIIPINKNAFHIKPNESNVVSIDNNRIDEEITNYFFNAIHNNYLSTRKNSLKG